MLNFLHLPTVSIGLYHLLYKYSERPLVLENTTSCEGNHLIYVHSVISLLEKLATLQPCEMLFIASELQSGRACIA